MAQFLAGTKRNTFRRNLRCRFPGTLICRRIQPFLEGTKRHIKSDCSSAATRTKSTEQPNDLTLSFAFLGRDRLCISVQCDWAGGVPKQFLHYLDVRSGCPQ